MTNPIARRVSKAIVQVNPQAGRTHGVEDETPATRIENLLKDIGNYGPYIAEGDPHGWGGGGTLATIYMEPKGSPGDCEIPLDYYAGGLNYSCEASHILGDIYIEFVNAAVACVYPS